MTRSFKATVQARIAADAGFRDALLQEVIDAILEGDCETGNAILRDFIGIGLVPPQQDL
ncbi:MAG: hypothetical protein KGI67_02945 [Pseudomonadota bacterium]|nr:hypothetical protein [Pseudomonadota bacterium]